MQASIWQELRAARIWANRGREIGPTHKGKKVMNSNVKMMQIVGAVERTLESGEKKSWWTRIGVAFENADGSFALKFDYLPANMAETTIQVRKIQPKEGAQQSE
jgi:hypothetical protein